MTFGYSMLCGRLGAEGYIRASDGKRSVSARGMQPGETCILYALTGNGAEICDRKTADFDGHAMLETQKNGSLFVCQNDAVRLWEADDDIYLRACAYLASQRFSAEDHLPEETEDKKESAQEQETPTEEMDGLSADSVFSETEKAFPQEEASPAGKEDENPVYTLRAPTSGEPVDALPERNPYDYMRY